MPPARIQRRFPAHRSRPTAGMNSRLPMAYRDGARVVRFCPMVDLSLLLSPPPGLTITMILLIAFVLGLLHGATPDEHTWPITFSYAIGSYSSKEGMKAGFTFSLGFTAQRALLTTLGFLGLATIYKAYNLDGPVYIVVGAAMAFAGWYVLKGRYPHLPFDSLLHGREHHSTVARRQPIEQAHLNRVPLRMALVHGLIAGFGFGAYATIITFILAPEVPSLIYAPLVGVAFGVGTMAMQVIFGALFASFARIKKLSEDDVCYLGRSTAGRTLYYGGIMFAAVGLFLALFPSISDLSVATGNPIPNLDSIGIATGLVLAVVGGVGIWSMIQGVRELRTIDSGAYCHPETLLPANASPPEGK